MKINGFVVILFAILAIAAIWVFKDLIVTGQCALCGVSWTNIGYAGRVDTGYNINIGNIITTANNNLDSGNQFITNKDSYSGCLFSIDKIFRYRPTGGNERIMIKSGSNYYDEDLTSGVSNGGIFTKCPASPYYKLWINGVIGPCVPVNSSEAGGLSGNYDYVERCPATGRVDVYIQSNSISDFECSVGATNMKTCSDGSKILYSQCTNHIWTKTGNVCPTIPTPQCTQNVLCSNNQNIVQYNCVNGQLVDSGNSCTVPQCTQDKTITCPTGEIITGVKCINGNYVPTGQVCTNIPDPNKTDYTLINYIVIGILIFIGLGIIGIVFLVKHR